MNTRLLQRFLETKGDRARYNVEEAELLRVLHLRSFDDDELIELSYRDPSSFALALSYLSWRDLTSNGQDNREGYVFWSALEKGIQERKTILTKRLEGMAYTVPITFQEDIP